MKKIAIFLFTPLIVFSQTIYNPQQLYDNPGGFFDEDSLCYMVVQPDSICSKY